MPFRGHCPARTPAPACWPKWYSPGEGQSTTSRHKPKSFTVSAAGTQAFRHRAASAFGEGAAKSFQSGSIIPPLLRGAVKDPPGAPHSWGSLLESEHTFICILLHIHLNRFQSRNYRSKAQMSTPGFLRLHPQDPCLQ